MWLLNLVLKLFSVMPMYLLVGLDAVVCGFVDDVTCETFYIKNSKVLGSAIISFFCGHFTFIQYLPVVVFDYVGRVNCAAVAYFKVVFSEDLEQFVWFWEMVINRVKEGLYNICLHILGGRFNQIIFCDLILFFSARVCGFPHTGFFYCNHWI